MRRAERMVVVGIVGAIAAISAYLVFIKPSPTGLVKPPAIQSGKFADGEVIELIDIRKGTVTHRGPTRGKAIRAESTVTSRYAFWPAIEITKTTDTIRKQLIEYRINSGNPDPLVVEFRWIGSHGEIRKPRRVNAGGDLLDFPDDFSSAKLSMECMPSADMIASPTQAPAAPDIIVQIPDGRGEWGNGSGPVWVDEDPHASCFVFFPAWIRTDKNLKLRFIRCGQPPLEFTVANPDFRSAKPFPTPSGGNGSKFVHPEFEVELAAVSQRRHYDQFPMLKPEFQFLRTHGFEKYWQWTPETVEDEMGNQSTMELTGRFPLPDSGMQIRFHGLAEPTEYYPREFSECLPVCEGTLQSDGSLALNPPIAGNTPRIINIKSRALSGTESETVLRFAAPRDLIGENIVESPGDTAVPQRGFSIELSGECSNADFSALERRLGDMKSWRIVLFKNGEQRSVGARFFSGNSTSITMGMKSYNLQEHWVGRIKPGDTVKVCLARKKDPVPVSLTFPKPDIKPASD